MLPIRPVLLPCVGIIHYELTTALVRQRQPHFHWGPASRSQFSTIQLCMLEGRRMENRHQIRKRTVNGHLHREYHARSHTYELELGLP